MNHQRTYRDSETRGRKVREKKEEESDLLKSTGWIEI